MGTQPFGKGLRHLEPREQMAQRLIEGAQRWNGIGQYAKANGRASDGEDALQMARRAMAVAGILRSRRAGVGDEWIAARLNLSTAEFCREVEEQLGGSLGVKLETPAERKRRAARRPTR